jgi:hypothetical protein
MQQALIEMNPQLHHMVSVITAATGMPIFRAIVAGGRDPDVLAPVPASTVRVDGNNPALPKRIKSTLLRSMCGRRFRSFWAQTSPDAVFITGADLLVRAPRVATVCVHRVCQP